LKNKDDTLFFDAGTTQMRPTLLAKAIRAGKHVYCEKPIATNLNEAVEIARLAEKSGLKHGAVQDKLFLPGLRKLDMLRRAGFFGKMLSVRLEFGYWVFEGDLQPIQRPSWNYRTEDGGGMILDMMCHWRYVLDNLFGEVKSISCIGATHIPERWDEAGKPYKATADDAAYATAELIRSQRRARHCADEHVLGHARQPRRPGHLPRRRHPRLSRRRPELMQGPVARQHAAPRLEPGRESRR
jgi:predicted dehydrogenase